MNLLAELAGTLAAPFEEIVVYGPMGIMLAWFAFRAEKKADETNENISYLAREIKSMTTAFLLETLSRSDTGGKLHEAAAERLRKIEAEEERDSLRRDSKKAR